MLVLLLVLAAVIIFAQSAGFAYWRKRQERLLARHSAESTRLHRESDDLKSEFVSTVSHELRTPLTSIGGYTKVLLDGDAGPLNETQREFLRIVDTNVERLTELINDLLDVDKMESGKVLLRREVIDLREVLEESVETFKLQAERKGLRLELRGGAEPLNVHGDRSRLLQVFMNLVSNAVKYTEKGSVTLESSRDGDAVMARVRDTGIGIPESDREKLFSKFYRTGQARLSGEGGTGLGLVIVRGLVEAHEGRIDLSSEEGKGSVFTVTLPGAEPSSAVARVFPGVGAARTIWIVDPRGALGPSAREGLERAFGATAQAFVRFQELPEGEGPALLLGVFTEEELRAAAKRFPKSMPILAISDRLDAGTAFAAGARALVSIPVDAKKLHAAVAELLSSRGQRVLIADADTDLRLLTKRSLEKAGFEVDDVDLGNLVLRRLEKEAYDLVLLDLNFPDASGADVIRAIRQDSRHRELRIFVMLGNGGDLPSRQSLLSMGADQFVGKHEGLGGIVDAVSQSLTRAGAPQ